MAQTTSLLLGESFTISLTSPNVQQDYQKLDLSDLKRDFYIDDSAQTSQRIRLRLTPYRSGQFSIPSLQAGNLQIPAQTLEVRENPEVEIEWSAFPHQAWQGQRVSQNVQVRLANADLPVQMRAEERADLITSAQPIQQTLSQRSGQASSKTLVFSYAYALPIEPLRTTEKVMPQPYIQVQNRQGGRWLFYAPPHQMAVMPLPHYLPADIAVGKFGLEIERPFFHQRGELYYQTLKLKGEHTARLPSLSPWFLSLNQPEIESLQPQSNPSTQLTEAGLVMQQTLIQPYRINQLGTRWGLGQWPEVQLNVFDPTTGKLDKLVIPAQAYWVLPAGLYYFVWLVGLLMLGLIGWKLLQQTRLAWLWLRWYWQRKQAKTPLQQWQAYQHWAQARGLGHCPTQQAWLNAYQQKFGQNEKHQQALKSLSQALYQKPD
jgi:hypothetical protein